MTLDIPALALASLRGDDDALTVLRDAIEERLVRAQSGASKRLLRALRDRDWMRLVALVPIERLDITESEARRIVGGERHITAYAMTRVVLTRHESGYVARLGEAGGTQALRGSWPSREAAEAAVRSIAHVVQLARGRGEERMPLEISEHHSERPSLT